MNKLLENITIRLRAPEPEDLGVLYKWENDTDLWTLGAAIAPFSRYTLKQYLTDSTHDIYADKQLRLMIERKQWGEMQGEAKGEGQEETQRKTTEQNTAGETGETIGTVDLYDFDPFHRRAGVGILIDRKFRKQGFGLQTLKLIETYAFEFLTLHQLYALIPERNTASIQLFKKAGYAPTGRIVDWLSTGDNFADVQLFQKMNN